MSKPTPGPWEVAYLDRNEQAVVKAEHIEICTCWHHSVGSIEKEMHANARLIAAAPDMLEALRQCLGLIESIEAEREVELYCGSLARAAIAKAEGRTDV